MILSARNEGLTPGSGRSPGEGNGNPPQYSDLENPMDREAWRATVHGVAELDTTEHTHAEVVFWISCLPVITCCFLNALATQQGVWGLSSWPGIEPSPPALQALSLKPLELHGSPTTVFLDAGSSRLTLWFLKFLLSCFLSLGVWFYVMGIFLIFIF